MRGGEILTDAVITLREITAADIQLLYRWRNDPENRPMFRDDRPLDYETHCRFVERYLSGEQQDWWWMVEAAGEPVGTICLYGFSGDRRMCEFGRFIIGREHRGAGHGRRALRLAMSFGRSRGVERMHCEVLSSNSGALRLYERLGFRAKGIGRAGSREFVLMEAELNER